MLLPKLMSGLAGWEPRRGTEAASSMVEAWEPALPREMLQSLLATSVQPVLKSHVDRWPSPLID